MIMVNRTLVGLFMAILASQLLLSVTAAPSSMKPIHLDQRSNINLNPPPGPIAIHPRGTLKPLKMLQERDPSRPKPITLRPVRTDSFLPPLQRRQVSQDLRRLDLAAFAEMVYAAESEDRQGVMMANMTLFAPNGRPLILMERFEGLTSTVDCGIEGDGFIGLKFNDAKAYDYAREAWDWINAGDDDEFILITDHEGCAPGSERKAYHVHTIEYLKDSLFIKLFANHAPWGEISGSYELNFASMKPSDSPIHNKQPSIPTAPPTNITTQQTPLSQPPAGPEGQQMLKVQKRIFNKIKDGFDKAKDKIVEVKDKVVDKFADLKKKFGQHFDSVIKTLGEVGTKTLDKDTSLDISAGKPGEKKNIYTDKFQPKGQPPRQIIDCADCYLKGQIQVGGHLKVENFIPKEAWWTISPENFEAKVDINVKMLKTKGDPLVINLDLFHFPFGGITIPGVFNLGPKFEYEIGFKSSIDSDMDISFGFKASIPNEALIKGNLMDFKKSEVSNWDKSKLESLPFRINNGTVEASLEVTSNPVLGLELYAIGLIAYEAALKFKLPRVSTKFTTLDNPKGACKQGPTEPTRAVVTKTEVAIGIHFVVGKDAMVNAKPDFEKVLWEKKFPQPDKCNPVGPPRVAPPPSTTPTTPSKPPAASGASVPTPTPSIDPSAAMGVSKENPEDFNKDPAAVGNIETSGETGGEGDFGDAQDDEDADETVADEGTEPDAALEGEDSEAADESEEFGQSVGEGGEGEEGESVPQKEEGVEGEEVEASEEEVPEAAIGEDEEVPLDAGAAEESVEEAGTGKESPEGAKEEGTSEEGVEEETAEPEESSEAVEEEGTGEEGVEVGVEDDGTGGDPEAAKDGEDPEQVPPEVSATEEDAESGLGEGKAGEGEGAVEGEETLEGEAETEGTEAVEDAGAVEADLGATGEAEETEQPVDEAEEGAAEGDPEEVVAEEEDGTEETAEE